MGGLVKKSPCIIITIVSPYIRYHRPHHSVIHPHHHRYLSCALFTLSECGIVLPAARGVAPLSPALLELVNKYCWHHYRHYHHHHLHCHLHCQNHCHNLVSCPTWQAVLSMVNKYCRQHQSCYHHHHGYQDYRHDHDHRDHNLIFNITTVFCNCFNWPKPPITFEIKITERQVLNCGDIPSHTGTSGTGKSHSIQWR